MVWYSMNILIVQKCCTTAKVLYLRLVHDSASEERKKNSTKLPPAHTVVFLPHVSLSKIQLPNAYYTARIIAPHY